MKVVLKWTLSPPDYLKGYEEKLASFFQASLEGGVITISEDADESADAREIQRQIEHEIKSFLMSVALTDKRRKFSLTCPGIDLESDGHNYYLFVEPGMYTISGSGIDFILTTKDGKIIDSKGELLAKQQELFRLISEYGTDEVAVEILESFRNALEYDDNKLFYLYKIRETLKNCFENGKGAITVLSLSRTDWNNFGKLSNDKSVRQGRHFSEPTSLARDLTQEESEFVINFGAEMIEQYLSYLQNTKKNV